MGGQCQPGDIAPYILVPGSEKRVERFASLWDSARKVAQHYEFLVYTGKMGDVPISACSTGCGPRSTSIAVDEMAALGANTFIRAGVSGAIQPGLKAGDLIIASGAVRLDRTSEHYVFVEYPATAHYEVIAALAVAAEKFGYRYHIGIVASAATFSAGEGSTCFQGYRHSGMDTIESDLRAARVYDWDNETATLLTQCSLYGLRAGRINVIVDDPQTGAYNPMGEEHLVQTALEAIRILAAWDQDKSKNGAKYTLPAYPQSKEVKHGNYS
jgi:uridine phosphorylase